MTQVVGIEFCTDFFKDEKTCLAWLKANQWEDLCRVKGFKLRKNAQSKILTNERKRGVYQWSLGYGTYPRLDVKRYAEPVVIVTGTGNRFAPTDFPAPLPSTVAHERQKAARHAVRVAKLRADKQARLEAEGPKEPKPKRKKTSTAKANKKKKEDVGDEPVYGVKVGTPPM